MPISEYPRARASHGDRLDAQTAGVRPEIALEVDSSACSALATINANERLDGGFTPSTRCVSAAVTIERLSVPGAEPGRRVRSRTVAPGTFSVRHNRTTDASNGHRRALLSMKSPQCRHHGEL